MRIIRLTRLECHLIQPNYNNSRMNLDQLKEKMISYDKKIQPRVNEKIEYWQAVEDFSDKEKLSEKPFLIPLMQKAKTSR